MFSLEDSLGNHVQREYINNAKGFFLNHFVFLIKMKSQKIKEKYVFLIFFVSSNFHIIIFSVTAFRYKYISSICAFRSFQFYSLRTEFFKLCFVSCPFESQQMFNTRTLSHFRVFSNLNYSKK